MPNPHSHRRPLERIVYNLPSTLPRNRRTQLALDDNIYELRREKLKQIEALGQSAYRSKYEFTHTVQQILANYSAKTAEELENPRVNVRVAGRIMAIRLMGKAGFCSSAAGRAAAADLRQERCRWRQGIRALQAARPRRPHRRQRISVPHPHRRTDHPCRRDHFPQQRPLALARKVARADRRRTALPPALRRSGHESGSARSFLEAHASWCSRCAARSMPTVSSKSKPR